MGLRYDGQLSMERWGYGEMVDVQVTVVEAWSRKLLALSVLVVKSIYGDGYCQIVVGERKNPKMCVSKPRVASNSDSIRSYACALSLPQLSLTTYRETERARARVYVDT